MNKKAIAFVIAALLVFAGSVIFAGGAVPPNVGSSLDNTKLPLAGGTVTGPAIFQDTVSFTASSAVRSNLDVYSSAELATVSANLTGSNITATTTFLAAIGGAKVGGSAAQDFAAKDLTTAGKISQNVASNGYTIYQGHTAVSAEGEASKQLPLDGSTTSLTLASGTCGYAIAEVTGKLESTNSTCHVRLSWSFEMLDNTYSIVGNPASTTDQLNAATWSVSLGSDGNLYASGTPGTLWQVKRFEIGGL